VVPLRLQPGDDLRLALEAWMGKQQEQAGCVISAVGSLSPDGAHLHIAVSDSKGAVIGGHRCAGSLVRTTAELVIGLLPEWRFRRELDPVTGYAELRISSADLN
jgi:predicted DNA-binding protein with PD1-like motif